jgi:hypothetical protein
MKIKILGTEKSKDLKFLVGQLWQKEYGDLKPKQQSALGEKENIKRTMFIQW